jgi:coenzyme F420-reducing hydrogenase gamma subunit
MKRKKTLAVWKFASCDGCQLSILDCEDELLMLTSNITLAYFPEATTAVLDGPYDISLVEGSITTPDDAERIQRIREQSDQVVSIGACATSGGIQALRNFAQVDDYIGKVYAHPEYIHTLEESRAISDLIPVDYELRGCPVNKYQLLEVLSSLLVGKRPNIPDQSVCMDCKFNEITCLAVSKNVPCLGPVTHAGCGALCPKYHRGCFGCYGPKENANGQALADHLSSAGETNDAILRLFRNFNAGAPVFSNTSKKFETHG